MKKEDGFPGQISFILPEKIEVLIRRNPLISDLYLTDIGYYPRARNHFRERFSGSAQFILIYCTDGQGGDTGRRDYTYDRGRSFFYYSNRNFTRLSLR